MRIAATVFILAGLASGMGSAPADKYFGRIGMSTLRIRYEIAQLGKRYNSHKELPENISHLAALTEDAYYKWAAAYPQDTWLASTGYNLAQLYVMLPGADAHNRAIRAMTFVRDHYKNTRYSKQATAQLDRGVPLKPYPLWALRLRPTPSPSPSPLPSPLTSGSPHISPSPSATLKPSPAPKPTH